MESSTTIREMIASAKTIIVPSYQRAYSWEAPTGNGKRKHIDVFLADLEEYSQSGVERTPYYFGHFLFEEKAEEKTVKFFVVDGQQRLTTIVIFLSALFTRLRGLQALSDEQIESYEDMVKRNKTVRFKTVNYDDQIFQDYVINQSKTDQNGLETESSRRIINAFDLFAQALANKDADYLSRLLKVIADASCTTHTVKHDSEAIQMFIFQNDRGKKPSQLEIIKAQFMHHIHLYGGEDAQSLLDEITSRFESIYKSISSIGYKISEDDVLVYTLRVYKNTLSYIDTPDFITKQLSTKIDGVGFVIEFSKELAVSFGHLKVFFGEHERENHDIHSLVTLGGISVVLPFILKAYRFGLEVQEVGRLCKALESLVLRHRLIGTRADITTRINPIFVKFTDRNIQPILDRVNEMKTSTEWWWAFWNNKELQKVLQGGLNHSVARFLLWKYENYLGASGESGYALLRYDKIESPELEHIAPSTEPAVQVHGYDKYDEDFKNQYLNCLGNYLLVSKSHNSSISNITFPQKHRRYTALAQQREIQQLVPENGTWDRQVIQQRKEKIIDFVIRTF